MLNKKAASSGDLSDSEMTDLAYRALIRVGVDAATANFKVQRFPAEFILDEIRRVNGRKSVRSVGRYLQSTLTIDGLKKWESGKERTNTELTIIESDFHNLPKTNNKTPGNLVKALRIYWMIKEEYPLTDFRDSEFAKTPEYKKALNVFDL